MSFFSLVLILDRNYVKIKLGSLGETHMELEVKHFYQINNLQKNTLGKRHEIDVRLLNCVNLEKYIEDPFEIVFTTDFSEEINLDNKYKLWLICSGAYPNSHEYDGNMSPSDWREYRQMRTWKI